jgi:hypothetical protein
MLDDAAHSVLLGARISVLLEWLDTLRAAFGLQIAF